MTKAQEIFNAKMFRENVERGNLRRAASYVQAPASHIGSTILLMGEDKKNA